MILTIFETTKNITNVTNITTIINPNPVSIIAGVVGLAASLTFKYLEHKKNLANINLEYDDPNYKPDYNNPDYDIFKKYLTHKYILKNGEYVLIRK
jgi:hypothetical protein